MYDTIIGLIGKDTELAEKIKSYCISLENDRELTALKQTILRLYPDHADIAETLSDLEISNEGNAYCTGYEASVMLGNISIYVVIMREANRPGSHYIKIGNKLMININPDSPGIDMSYEDVEQEYHGQFSEICRTHYPSAEPSALWHIVCLILEDLLQF